MVTARFASAVLAVGACSAPRPVPPAPTVAARVPAPAADEAAVGESKPEPDLTDDVAIILETRDHTCAWYVVDARTRERRTHVETPGACPERVVFDPFGQATYFVLDDDVFVAPWNERTARKVVALPAFAVDSQGVFISALTDRVAVWGLRDYTEGELVKTDDGSYYQIGDEHFRPLDEDDVDRGTAALALVWDLDTRGKRPRWRRVAAQTVLSRFDLDEFRDIGEATSRAGTELLHTLLARGDCQVDAGVCSLGALASDEATDTWIAKRYPPNEVLDPNAPAATYIPIDDDHGLLAGVFAVHQVHITEPVFYCTDGCAKRTELKDLRVPPSGIDTRSLASHLPLYIAVRENIALVEEMMHGERVSFFAAGGAKPIHQFSSAIGAWGPFRGLWSQLTATP